MPTGPMPHPPLFLGTAVTLVQQKLMLCILVFFFFFP